jgi:hypothetical protein
LFKCGKYSSRTIYTREVGERKKKERENVHDLKRKKKKRKRVRIYGQIKFCSIVEDVEER